MKSPKFTGMDNVAGQLLQNIQDYKKKYYLNQALKGTGIFVAVLLLVYLAASSLEYVAYLPGVVRAILLFAFIVFFVGGAYLLIVVPLLKLLNLRQQLSNEEAAKEIGRFFPEIKDRLLNTIQLQSISSGENELLLAGIRQKSKQLVIVRFSEAVDLKESYKYLRFAAIPVLSFLALLAYRPSLFTESNYRIIRYQKPFSPPAPFRFEVQNNTLQAFRNEDFEFRLKLSGSALPESAYLVLHGRKQKLNKTGPDTYSFTFQNLENDTKWYVEAGGYNSDEYHITVNPRPSLKGFGVSLDYPAYLHRKNEQLVNMGNLLVPEGTWVSWTFQADETDSLLVRFGAEKKAAVAALAGGNFSFRKQLRKSDSYSVYLRNHFSTNKEPVDYSITVVPDEKPSITLEHYKDTSLYHFLVFAGNVSDDYGISALRLFYKKGGTTFHNLPLKINKQQNSQSYYFRWEIDSLALKPGEKLEYYLSVWDNDGVNGPKATRSAVYEMKLPDRDEAQKQLEEADNQAEKSLNNTLEKAEQMKKEIRKLEQKLKTKRNFDWQDKKAIEELLKQHQQLQSQMEQLKEQHKELFDKKERLGEQTERIAEKTRQLQEIMQEMLDDDTKKMYEELARLLQEKNKESEIKEMLEKIQKKDLNVEKELDRALEMFKQLKFDAKLEQISDKLKELAQNQEKQAEQNETKKPDEQQAKEAAKEQEKLNKEFEEVRKEVEELKDMNKELENKRELEETGKQEEQIAGEQEKSKESLEKGENKKAAKSQKKAADQMKELQEKMARMQQSMEMNGLEENMESLRDILDNLVTLSFDQEDLMKEFRKVNQQDPRFVALSQKQIKLKDDAKIIEDSLYALAKRAFQIQAFITRELEAMNGYMDEASLSIRQRRPEVASGKQQFAMTSMNNLALMLSDVLEQMQEQKADGMKGGAMCNSKKKSKKGDKPGGMKLSEMQKKLNQQMEEIKKSGMSGRVLSEELSKLARQQEQIRNAMQEMEEKNKGKAGKQEGGEQSGGKPLDKKLKDEMEKTENDLVNKRLSQELLMRQKDILTRLLEHENALRERELDKEREAEQAKEKEHKLPPELEQYLKARQKQVELLRTIAPNLTPYYKQEANEYFRKLNMQ